MLRHIHQATTASARPPRQTRTHILEGRLPGRCHVAQLHPAHERTHAISSVPLRSYLLGEPSQRGPFVFAPKSEIQDDIGMKLKSAQSYPDQTTFQGISFCLIVSSK